MKKNKPARRLSARAVMLEHAMTEPHHVVDEAGNAYGSGLTREEAIRRVRDGNEGMDAETGQTTRRMIPRGTAIETRTGRTIAGPGRLGANNGKTARRDARAERLAALSPEARKATRKAEELARRKASADAADARRSRFLDAKAKKNAKPAKAEKPAKRQGRA